MKNNSSLIIQFYKLLLEFLEALRDTKQRNPKGDQEEWLLNEGVKLKNQLSITFNRKILNILMECVLDEGMETEAIDTFLKNAFRDLSPLASNDPTSDGLWALSIFKGLNYVIDGNVLCICVEKVVVGQMGTAEITLQVTDLKLWKEFADRALEDITSPVMCTKSKGFIHKQKRFIRR